MGADAENIGIVDIWWDAAGKIHRQVGAWYIEKKKKKKMMKLKMKMTMTRKMKNEENNYTSPRPRCASSERPPAPRKNQAGHSSRRAVEGCDIERGGAWWRRARDLLRWW